MGLHCVDCVYSSFTLNEEAGLYQGACSRGYTLANPHVAEGGLASHFAERPEELVPAIDPFGNEYLRTSNVCERFLLPHARDGEAQPRRTR